MNIQFARKGILARRKLIFLKLSISEYLSLAKLDISELAVCDRLNSNSSICIREGVTTINFSEKIMPIL